MRITILTGMGDGTSGGD